MEADEGSVAGRWFAVRVEFETHVGGRRVWDLVKHVLLGVVTLGISLVDYDPRRASNVVLLRHDNGSAVLGFRYSTLGGAALHATSLAERLERTHVFDFCRELGLPMSVVAGEGRPREEGGEVTWRGYEVGRLPTV